MSGTRHLDNGQPQLNLACLQKSVSKPASVDPSVSILYPLQQHPTTNTHHITNSFFSTIECRCRCRSFPAPHRHLSSLSPCGPSDSFISSTLHYFVQLSKPLSPNEPPCHATSPSGSAIQPSEFTVRDGEPHIYMHACDLSSFSFFRPSRIDASLHSVLLELGVYSATHLH